MLAHLVLDMDLLDCSHRYQLLLLLDSLGWGMPVGSLDLDMAAAQGMAVAQGMFLWGPACSAQHFWVTELALPMPYDLQELTLAMRSSSLKAWDCTCVRASLLRRRRRDRIRKKIARQKQIIPTTTPAILPPDQ